MINTSVVSGEVGGEAEGKRVMPNYIYELKGATYGRREQEG